MLREEVIDEDFESTNELNELAEDVMVNYCKVLARTKASDKLPEVKIFNEIDKGKYDKLEDFLNEFQLRFAFNDRLPNGALGLFKPLTRKIGLIYIDDDDNELLSAHHVLEDDPYSEEKYRKIYFASYSDSIVSTILHELQHAYDHWRSEGKFTKSKETHKFRDKVKSVLKKNAHTDSSDVFKAVHKDYLRQPHEISSRFEQAIRLVKFYDNDWTGSDLKKLIPMEWDEVLSSFKLNFEGWREMRPTIQKNLLRRLSQYYHKYDEYINDYNSEKK